MKEKAAAETKTAELEHLGGSRPAHEHECPGKGAKVAHRYKCNSPYCESSQRRCPDCGGNQPYFDE